MANSEKMLDLQAVLLAEDLDLDAIFAAGHLARQFNTVHQQASRDFAEIQNTNQSHQEARLAAGHWILNNGEEAVARAKKDPAHPVSQVIMGLFAEKSAHWADALAHYEKAAEKNARAELLRANALRHLGKTDEALKLIIKLEKEFGDTAALHCEKGRCLESSGKPEEALAAYNQALEFDANCAAALFYSARLLDLHGDDAAAIARYEKIGPATPDTYYNALVNLATLYEDNGRESDAMRCCQMILRQNPNHKRVRLIADSISASTGMFYSPEENKQTEKLEAILRVPVTDFELSVRSRNCLAKMNIRTLGDLVKRTESELLAYKNFGETSLREIRDILNSRNLRLGMLREDAATRANFNRSSLKMHDELLQKSIDFLELSVRSRKCMDRLGIRMVGQLCDKSESDLESSRNFGRVSLNEIKKRLLEHNLALRGD